MYIADLHIHSKYSRATSGQCVPEYLELWARRKGIDLLGTGDFTHPAWREMLKEKLEPREEGLYVLRDALRLRDPAAREERLPRFVVSGEISSIYKKDGRVRKIHNLILLPSIEAAQTLSRRLEIIGNLHSDGRPILGLDSRDLMEIVLESCPQAVFIPAHIWTPHFSLFGAFSGFDTMEACFEDMTPHIHAVETGLSSDPPMNWRLSALDGYQLVSNSDAHSPKNLGREANLLDTELSYPALAKALAGGGGLAGTIEFFPEEGKYHFDGHRNCQLCLQPGQSEGYFGMCPVCGKKLTIGVLHRVEQLADREEDFVPPGALPFESLVPLAEVIAGSTGYTPSSARVMRRYDALLEELGPEFYVLRSAPLADVGRIAGPLVEEGLRRMRAGRVELSPGYDGEYGKIKLLTDEEIEALSGQLCFFSGMGTIDSKAAALAKAKLRAARTAAKTAAVQGKRKAAHGAAEKAVPAEKPSGALRDLNGEQRQAATAGEAAVAVVAGPGTGKTKTLVARAAYLVEGERVKPQRITAVTFTNKAAQEMEERLRRYFGGGRIADAITIGTFHAVSLELLRAAGESVRLIDEFEALSLVRELAGELGIKASPKKLLEQISKAKSGAGAETVPEGLLEGYARRMEQEGALDFDDLLLRALALAESGEAPKQLDYLLVDEFQDVSDLQYRLVRAWGRRAAQVFVIGDPDQAIYGFRGSDGSCFQRFLEEHPGARRIALQRNYRCTPGILHSALGVIEKNGGVSRTLMPQRENGAAVRLLEAKDDFTQALFIVKEINRMVGGIDMLDTQVLPSRREEARVRGFGEIAVLYRTHRQAELLEKCLQQEGVPYVVAGRDSVLEDETVRGTVGFFRSLLDPGDTVSLRAALHTLGCPENQSASLLEAVRSGAITGPVWELTENLEKLEGLRGWAAQARGFAARIDTEKPQRLLEDWMLDNGFGANVPLQRLTNMTVFHQDLASFVRNLTLGKESDVVRSGNRSYCADAVSLMTLHGAKGTEFHVVFLCSVKKGVLPLEMPGRETDSAEERRLFYVGMTRARDELVMITGPQPSVFLSDIPSGLLEKGRAAETVGSSGGKQMSLFD